MIEKYIPVRAEPNSIRNESVKTNFHKLFLESANRLGDIFYIGSMAEAPIGPQINSETQRQ